MVVSQFVSKTLYLVMRQVETFYVYNMNTLAYDDVALGIEGDCSDGVQFRVPLRPACRVALAGFV